MQPPFDNQPGVVHTQVGYMGGHVDNPSYEQVCSGTTGHAEVIQVQFNPEEVSYSTLLEVFWHNVNPTTLNQQFADRGTQYRTAIFYHDPEQQAAAEASKVQLQQSNQFSQPVVTEIVPATTFYPAEDYHQFYYQKNQIHYQMYKHGSGRAAWLKQQWGNGHSSVD